MNKPRGTCVCVLMCVCVCACVHVYASVIEEIKHPFKDNANSLNRA